MQKEKTGLISSKKNKSQYIYRKKLIDGRIYDIDLSTKYCFECKVIKCEQKHYNCFYCR